MPMMFKELPSQSLLRRWFFYDEGSGDFIKLPWKGRASFPAWSVAGSRGPAAIKISVGGEQYQAHRLAWVYVHGSIPESMEVDHIDNDPFNNMLSNLRLATSSEQKHNKRVQSNNRTGLKGAYYHACHKGKKWRSQIKVGRVLHFLGYFHTAEEAHQAYRSAATLHFGEFARF